MNKFKKIFPVVVLTIATVITADEKVAPFIGFRSPGRDTARKVVGMSDKHMHLYDMEAFYGTFSITPAYERSFKSDRIADCLFGQFVNDDRQILIQDSQVANRSDKALASEHFLLPRDFSSTIKVTPRVQNFLVDFHFYMALDEWCEGLYFKLYGPIVHTQYDLNAEETNVAPGSDVQAGFFANEATPTSSLHKNALSFFNGENDLTLSGVTVNKLASARFKKDKDKETCFGELRAELGYNLLLDEDYHFGINIQGAAPTGHRPTGDYLFEAQCGNNKHWELGGGATMHYTLWRCEDGNSHFDFFSEIDITHLFETRQKRTFDLKNKPLSRYMLASKFKTSGITDLFVGTVGQMLGANDDPAPAAVTAALATAQFAGELAPVANFTTVDVDVDISVQVDWVAMLNYTYCNWSMDLGYNLWYRSSENIELRSGNEDNFPKNTWGLKGDEELFGFERNGNVPADPLNPTALSGTVSASTINDISSIDADNQATAFNELTDTTNRLVAADSDNANVNLMNTSNPPVFIKATDLDIEGAQTKGISHKIFGHINYTWMDCEDWLPYVGIGASAEFGNRGNSSKNSSNSDSDTLSCSLSKWSVMLKAGISFD